ncbi:MAG: hypothetical protein RLO52_02900 [Sandaracinaceae bacterium]|nr:MAG: hypothetical protein EVA89_21080 [Sandaracinaceae bacterium]HBQ12252.1 hypothetical protein [Myxococcales bacterium]
MGTVLATVAAAGSGIALITSQDQLSGCDELESADPPIFGCVNRPDIITQRDVALGLTVGLGVVALGLGVAWLIAALTERGDAPAEAAATMCGPGALGLDCRF